MVSTNTLKEIEKDFSSAVGLQGWHKVRTIIRFIINGKQITNCEVVELGGKAAKVKS